MISPNKNQMQGEIDDHEAAKNATEQRKERNGKCFISFGYGADVMHHQVKLLIRKVSSQPMSLQIQTF